MRLVFRFRWLGLCLWLWLLCSLRLWLPCSLSVFNLLLLLQLLLLLVVLLLHLLKLLLLLLLELLLPGFIRLLLFDLLLNLLLLAELFLLKFLAFLILLLLQLLILDFVLLLELGIHGWWGRADASRSRRTVLIDPRISRGIGRSVGGPFVWITLLHCSRLIAGIHLLRVCGRVGRPVVVGVHLLPVTWLSAANVLLLLCVNRRRPIVVVLQLSRAIGIIGTDAWGRNRGCRGNANGSDVVGVCSLHFQLARFRNGNGTALIGLNRCLTLRERKRSWGRCSLSDDLARLKRRWRTHIADRTAAEDRLFRRSDSRRSNNHRSGSDLPAVDGHQVGVHGARRGKCLA